jgi:hypothetical protein
MIRDGSDKTALICAFTAFISLRQIRLMRVTDEDDRGWAIFLRNNPTYADEGTASEWSSASEHAISTIFAAAKQTVSKFPSDIGGYSPYQKDVRNCQRSHS